MRRIIKFGCFPCPEEKEWSGRNGSRRGAKTRRKKTRSLNSAERDTLDSLKDRQRKEREKAREAALAVAKRVADEKKKLLERSRKRWEDGEDEDDEDEVSSEKIESKQEE